MRRWCWRYKVVLLILFIVALGYNNAASTINAVFYLHCDVLGGSVSLNGKVEGPISVLRCYGFGSAHGWALRNSILVYHVILASLIPHGGSFPLLGGVIDLLPLFTWFTRNWLIFSSERFLRSLLGWILACDRRCCRRGFGMLSLSSLACLGSFRGARGSGTWGTDAWKRCQDVW